MDGRDQTLAQLRLVACHAGYRELRALHRSSGKAMEPRGSFFVIASKTADSLIYDRLETAMQRRLFMRGSASSP